MSDKVIKSVRVNDGYQASELKGGCQGHELRHGYQPVKNCVKIPKPPKTGSVIDVPKNKK